MVDSMWFYWFLFAIVMGGAVSLIIIMADSHRFVIRNYSITIRNLKKEMVAVLLGDLHNQSYGEGNEELIKAIDKIHPDIILVAGDMLTASEKEGTENALALLLSLAKDYPVYYGNGNHELKVRSVPEVYGDRYGEYRKRLTDEGVRLLLNEHVYLPEYNLDIYGLELEKHYFKRFVTYKMPDKYMEEKLGVPEEGHGSILIAHNPEYFPDYARWGANLTVSGHIHGGMVRLPFLGGVISPKVHLFPKYDGGLFEEGDAGMIISRGIGGHPPNIRMFNPAELVVITLSGVNRESTGR